MLLIAAMLNAGAVCFAAEDGRRDDLIRSRDENDKQLRILNNQIEMYNEYLASDGRSVEVVVQRHSDTIPRYVIILGSSAGGLMSASGLSLWLGRRFFPVKVTELISQAVAKRFVVAGALTIIVSWATSAILYRRYSSDENLARNEALRRLDDTDRKISNNMLAEMVQEKIHLEEDNHRLDAELQNAAQ